MDSRTYIFEYGAVIVPNAGFLSADDICKNEEEMGELQGVKYKGRITPVSLNDWRCVR